MTELQKLMQEVAKKLRAHPSSYTPLTAVELAAIIDQVFEVSSRRTSDYVCDCEFCRNRQN